MPARRSAVHVLLSLLLSLSAADAAPVPRRPLPECPIVPGFRWWFQGSELEITRTEGETVWYRNLTNPARTWPSSVAGIDAVNVQTKSVVRSEIASNYQPPRLHWNRLVFEP